MENIETEKKAVETLKALLGSHTVAYRVIFAKAIGNVPAAIMLSQGFFWQESADFKETKEFDGKPYFQKTAEQWYDATGLTEEQQKTARRHLCSLGMMNERRAGLPAKLYYNIDFEVTVAVIYRYKKEGKAATVDNRSKKRELTRHSNGKLRGRFAVNYGDNYGRELKESLESLKESLAENKFPQPGLPVTVEDQKKENSPSSGAGPLRLTIIDGYEEIVDFEPYSIPAGELADIVVEQARQAAKAAGPKEPKKRAKKQVTPSDGVIQAMVTAFESEHQKHFKDAGGEWIGFTWHPKEFPALNSIRKELEKRYAQKMAAQPTPENIVESWALFLTRTAKCDKFVLENLFTPSKLWGQFQSIINKIHSTNGAAHKPGFTATRKADKNERDRAALENLVNEIADGRI